MSYFTPLVPLFFFSFSLVLIPTEKGWANITYWNKPSGEWGDSGNWSEGTPTNSSTATISNGGTAIITKTTDIARADSVLVNKGRIELNGGVLETSIVRGAFKAGSIFSFNGGTLRATTNNDPLLLNFIPSTLRVESTGGTIDTNKLSLVHEGPTGPGGMTYIGGGTATIRGGSYSGTTKITATTTLTQGLPNYFSPHSDVVIDDGSKLDLGGYDAIIGILAGPPGSQVTNSGNNPVTLNIRNTNTSGTYAGNITNGVASLRLNKVGTGTQTLSGTSTYSGNTTVTAGAILLVPKHVSQCASNIRLLSKLLVCA